MSAFICDGETVDRLVMFGAALGLIPREGLTMAGRQMMLENVVSVTYRYSDCAVDDLPGPCDQSRVWNYAYAVPSPVPTAAQVLDDCGSWLYQSCEHPEHENGAAWQLVEAIKAACGPLAKAEAQAKADAFRASPAAHAESLSPKQTAAILRRILKAQFPATRFSVVTGRGAGVSSVDVAWQDGPTVKAVKAITSTFEAGSFDGMTDSYDYDRNAYLTVDGVLYRPGCRYVFERREISAALARRCVEQVAAYWGGVTVQPTVDAYPSGGYRLLPDGIGHQSVRADLDSYRNDWHASISRAAEDRTAFQRD